MSTTSKCRARPYLQSAVSSFFFTPHFPHIPIDSEMSSSISSAFSQASEPPVGVDWAHSTYCWTNLPVWPSANQNGLQMQTVYLAIDTWGPFGYESELKTQRHPSLHHPVLAQTASTHHLIWVLKCIVTIFEHEYHYKNYSF